ncbi:hypothetical protein halTADL_0220 [Halohasta litchfieldiae]|jgi:hypothetical protein|uniref:Uncharacterized protein n=1 Tax=Halohasta litchfieldiae TaxID=1073996 RepID=A0A1H6WCY5_9EURY|nr:hypothetical protein [Halohasta litchfieldiae]ATW87041.1 hypothetical protein halTADL_0220 [Halohasta litchfieldiae]SEJ13084.1 hypothetical protein SAMN05444271_12345 [Halohasta litchfieldiae]
MVGKNNSEIDQNEQESKLLTEVDYIAPKDCLPYYHSDSDSADYKVISRKNDRFGNTLSGILSDGENYAFGYRRDDCQNRDGSKPSWKIYQAGSEVKVMHVTGLPEHIKSQFNSVGEEIEDLIEHELVERFTRGEDGCEILQIENGYLKLREEYKNIGVFEVELQFESK